MGEQVQSDDRIRRVLRWVARVWSLPIILYTVMMVIGYAWNIITIGTADPYAVGPVPFLEALPPILLFLSVIGLAIAWWRERIGASITLLFLITTFILLLIQRPIDLSSYHMLIPYILVLIVLIPAILFFFCRKHDKGIFESNP